MGGGGSYYDRDVSSGASQSRRGYSAQAEERLSRRRVDSSVLPKNRKIKSNCQSPLVFAFDVTGSMGDLPKVIYDKMPMIAGQLAMQKYLEDSQISLAAIGDVESDSAPIQICDFSQTKFLDEWLQRLWLEGGGGGQGVESYEMTAYFYAYCYRASNAQTPIFIFTGDEGFRNSLPKAQLTDHFGGSPEGTNATSVFTELKKKFKGNVFMILPTFTSGGAHQGKHFQRWQEALGSENIILLEDKRAIADIALGLIAIAGGSRSLTEYIEDIQNRPLEMGGVKFEPQSEKRINQVKEALEPFARSRNLLSGVFRKSSPSEPTQQAAQSKSSKKRSKASEPETTTDWKL